MGNLFTNLTMRSKICLFFSILFIISICSNAKNMLPVNTTPYRTILFQKIDHKRTILKADENSSPLRVTKEELGRFTWTFLHSVAAAYPQEPTENDKIQSANLIN